VVVVEDEPQIRRFLRVTLGGQGYRVHESGTGADGLVEVATRQPDVVILDLGLPDMDGLELNRAIRANSSVPIVVLSIRGDEREKVEALDRGADDYVTKPFGMAELVARIRTALRHRYQAQGETPVFASGDLAVDLVRRHVRVRGEQVRLSPKEYEILKLLVSHAGKVLTHRHILRSVWGPAQENDVQYLRVFVRQLRQKLEADAARPTHILTEPGVGYRLAVPH
jgi:two-component system KDP operon response regulator KdpE